MKIDPAIIIDLDEFKELRDNGDKIVQAEAALKKVLDDQRIFVNTLLVFLTEMHHALNLSQFVESFNKNQSLVEFYIENHDIKFKFKEEEGEK